MATSKEPLALAGTVAELRALDAGEAGHDELGGRAVAPRPDPRPRGPLERLRASSWPPLLGRGAAIVGGLALFAGIGIYSTEAHPLGVRVASQVAPGAAVSWLAPTPSLGSATTPPNSTSREPVAGAPPPSSKLAGVSARNPCSAPGALCEHDKKKESPSGITADGKVILNVAGPEALTRLPGVGERRAEAIVKLRERLKRFRRPSDLLRVRGIGVRSLKRMLPHLVLDPPPTDQQDDGSKQESVEGIVSPS